MAVESRYLAGIPKSLEKTFRKKEKEERKKAESGKQTEALPMESGHPLKRNILFVENEKYGLIGVYEDVTYFLSDVLPLGTPAAGEVWTCYVETGQNPLGDTCIPCQKISVAPSSEDDEECNEQATVSEVTQSKDAVLARADSETEELRKELEALKAENAEYRNKCKQFQDLYRQKDSLEIQVSELRKELNTQNDNNSQLRNQIRALERKSKASNLENLEVRVHNLESENTNLRFQIERMSMIIESNDLDVENVKGRKVFAIMTGSEVMHSNAFNDGRYTVQFGNNFRTLRLIPDENGAVECSNGDIRLPALGAYANFAHLDKLTTVIEDGIITVNA